MQADILERHAPGKRVYAKSVSRVRISLTPPQVRQSLWLPDLFFTVWLASTDDNRIYVFHAASVKIRYWEF